MTDGESLLVPHCVRCAFREAPVRCTRCDANEYCSEIHQKDDTQRHRKGQCKAVLDARERLRHEERALRDAPADGMFLPRDVFTNGVGDFYAIHETRKYMAAKYDLIVELANVGSYSAMVNALEEAQDAMRLDEQDHLSLHVPVPAFLVLMGRFQEAYDFIRYWTVYGDSGAEDEADEEDDHAMDEERPMAPCFRKKGALMTESIDLFTTSSHVSTFHLCALAFLKLMVKFGIRGAIQKLASEDEHAKNEAIEFLEANQLPIDEEELLQVEKLMERHAVALCGRIQQSDAHFWYPIYMPKMINAARTPWTTAYADMFHWFPPALEVVRDINVKISVQVREAASQARPAAA